MSTPTPEERADAVIRDPHWWGPHFGVPPGDESALRRLIAAAVREAEHAAALALRERAACKAETLFAARPFDRKADAGEAIGGVIRALEV